MQREIADALPLPLVGIGRDGRIIGCNRAFRAVFALGSRDLAGDDLFSLREWYFDDPGIHEAWTVVREGRSEARCTFSRDEDRCYEVTVQQVVGLPEGASLLVFSDISDRVQAETDRSQCRAQLEIVNAIIRAATSRMTTVEILDAVLEQVIALLGFDAGAIYLVGDDPLEAELRASLGLCELVFAGAPTLRLDAAPHAGLLDGRACYYETYLDVAHEEGELGVFSAASVPVFADDRVLGIIAVASSNFHRFSYLEREVLEAIGAELGAAVRRGALETELVEAHETAELYLDVITHDLGNLQTAALAQLASLEEALVGASPPAEVPALRELLQRGVAVVRNVGILRRLRTSSEALAPVSLAEALAPALNEGDRMAFVTEGTDVHVMADALLPEVFANLLGNSRKVGATRVGISAEEADGRVVVRISDDGPGIPDAEKERVFARYATGSAPGSGAGLGLWIVRALMERYGGSVVVGDRVPGAPGAGVAFTLDFSAPGTGGASPPRHR
jgi:signal transduction histidine kinase